MTYQEVCTRCGAKLNNKRIVWLELQISTGIYHVVEDIPKIPEEDSQGTHPFGSACAQRQLREQINN
jgi:hypothetical protein